MSITKFATVAAAATVTVGASLFAASPADAGALSDGGQRICSSKYSEVPIEVEGSRYRIQPNTCVTIGTHTRIIVLGESYSTAATAGAYDNCKVGYTYYDPARTYVKGFKAKNCNISI